MQYSCKTAQGSNDCFAMVRRGHACVIPGLWVLPVGEHAADLRGLENSGVSSPTRNKAIP